MSKKAICMILAVVISVCAVLCVVNAVRIQLLTGEVPSGILMLTLVTVFCAVMIWRGITQMDQNGKNR